MSESMLEIVVAMSSGKCEPDGPAWCKTHESFLPLLRGTCTSFMADVDLAAHVLSTFAKHDISGLTPHCDIGNRWYHDGIHAAQELAGEWADGD
jgi:hypothetical protein